MQDNEILAREIGKEHKESEAELDKVVLTQAIIVVAMFLILLMLIAVGLMLILNLTT